MPGRRRALRSADELVAPAVAETLATLTLAEPDAGAAQLARRYAAAIDNAADIAEQLRQAVEDVDGDAPIRQRIQALAVRVDAHQVLVDLGPKLLTALEALGATPRARALTAKGAGGPATVGRLAKLRASGL